jgi:dynamin 1-like protein
MSSVINAKQEKEKKAAQAEERRKRERRRLKEAGAGGAAAALNGTETPEDDEAADEEKTTQGAGAGAAGLPNRSSHAHQHQSKNSRSMSPAVRGGLDHGGHHSNIAAHLNGSAGGGLAAAGSATGSTRDSFLNYFFGKEGQLPPGGNNASSSIGQTRHVSHSNEPSFSQSIRRGDHRTSAVSQYAESEYDRDQHALARHQQYQAQDFDYNSPFVSLSILMKLASFAMTLRGPSGGHCVEL